MPYGLKWLCKRIGRGEMNTIPIVLPGLCLCFLFLTGCPNPASLAQFGIMTTGQITSSFDEGLASQPYLVYSGTSLEQINEVCEIDPGIRISLEDTYKSAYGRNLEETLPSGDTGQSFRNMKEATLYLQKILKDYGREDYEEYLLTSIDSVRDKGYVLFAVVKRSQRSISVEAAGGTESKKQLGAGDKEFYLPYQKDAQGESLDSIIDWAGLPNDCYSTQQSQAILLTLTANQVLKDKTRGDYWTAQEQWLKGNFAKVIKEQDEQTCVICGFEEGFFKG
jgi:hypothetical protein